MTQTIKKYWMILLGVLLMIAGVGSSFVIAGSSDVPNDPNIGGGVLFVFGTGLVIVGSIMAWANRQPPPPTG